MCTDIMDHVCELTTKGKLFFTLLVKATHVRLDSLATRSHFTTCVIFIFICVVNGILQNLQKIKKVLMVGKANYLHFIHIFTLVVLAHRPRCSST